MFRFGTKSKSVLKTVDELLQIIITDGLKIGLIDFSVIEGHRGKGKQNQLYKDGRSKVQWPKSKHNMKPSKAVDIVPYVNGKISWKKEHCIFLAGIILTCGKNYGTNIRWGGNWDMDGEPITDQDFQDLVHYELII